MYEGPLPYLQSKVSEILFALLQSANEDQSIRDAVKNINKLYPIEIEKFPEADEPDDFGWRGGCLSRRGMGVSQ